MGKVEVGVGEDFPVDEGKPKEGGERVAGERGGECPDRDAWREHRREWKQRWREHMREHHRGFRYEDYGHRGRFGRGYGLKALAVLGALALVIFVVSHLFTILVGAAAVAVLFAVYQHQHYGHRWDTNPRAPSEQK